MKTISSVTFLAVLSTIARISAAQCPAGTHLTKGVCCPDGTEYFQSPTGAHGACCPLDHTYYSNAAGNNGICCPPGTEYHADSNRCAKVDYSGTDGQPQKPIMPKPEPTKQTDPCAGCEGCCSPSNPAIGEPIKPGRPPGGPGIKIPSTPDGTCGCARGYACFNKDDLGIQYGKCYNLIDTNGLPLGRETNGVYQSGGDVQNLIFRVCKSTDDCSAELGTSVPQKTGKFYLQDQQGFTSWQGPAWFGNNWPHFAINRAKVAVQFKGEGVCMYGSPAICLRDGEKNRGMVAPCPLGANAAMSHIHYTNNPNACKAYRFIESSCLTDVVPEKN